eukprot:5829721-Pyramimonas_sp.AAC.1
MSGAFGDVAPWRGQCPPSWSLFGVPEGPCASSQGPRPLVHFLRCEQQFVCGCFSEVPEMPVELAVHNWPRNALVRQDG